MPFEIVFRLNGGGDLTASGAVELPVLFGQTMTSPGFAISIAVVLRCLCAAGLPSSIPSLTVRTLPAIFRCVEY